MNRTEKPHLYRYMGIWHCTTQRLGCMRMGLGYTPIAAYRDWEEM